MLGFLVKINAASWNITEKTFFPKEVNEINLLIYANCGYRKHALP
jgi:hypothetical protein